MTISTTGACNIFTQSQRNKLLPKPSIIKSNGDKRQVRRPTYRSPSERSTGVLPGKREDATTNHLPCFHRSLLRSARKRQCTQRLHGTSSDSQAQLMAARRKRLKACAVWSATGQFAEMAGLMTSLRRVGCCCLGRWKGVEDII